jgi:hypothetical protein
MKKRVLTREKKDYLKTKKKIRRRMHKKNK